MLLVGGVVSATGCSHPRALTTPAWPELTFTPADRLLILAPHPDDEVLGCGGIIQRAVAMGLPVQIVFLTYGDNNQWSFMVYRKHPVLTPRAVQRMGMIRYEEALKAANVLGVPPDHLTFLGYPDFGTLHIWQAHWGDRSPFRSMLTKVTAVPYPNALRPGAPYKGEEILRDLTTVLRTFRPTKVFVSHPGDHMPDHSALYLFTRIALWQVESEMTPELYPYLIHFKRWPSPRGEHPQRPLEPPTLFKTEIPWCLYRLSPWEVQRKRLAMRSHRTQYMYSARYLLSFLRPNELFGDFPSLPLQSHTTLMLSRKDAVEEGASVEELTGVERAAFIGLEERFAELIDDHLVLTITFSRPLAEAVSVSVDVLGYRNDRPFEQMPKLHMRLGAIRHEVLDQDRLLPAGTLQVTRHLRTLTISVPLKTLGDPQRILTSAQTSMGDIPLDWASWRILEVEPVPQPSTGR